MGNSEENKSSKSEKPSSPIAPDQTNSIHVYPDWATMQAYYGPRVAVPPPYYNSAVASGHPPHPYMWGPPQAMVPPYGTPYAALYAPGGVYAHPGVPLGSHANGHVVSPSPATVTEAVTVVPLSMEMPAKSSTANTDKSLINKLKGFDGLAMSIGNGNNGDRADAGADNGISQSEETEGSSDGSDGNTTKVCQNIKKRSREGTPNDTDREGKSVTPKSPIHSGDSNGTSSKVMNLVVTPTSDADKVNGAVLSPNMTTMLELKNPSGGGNSKASPAGEVWMQNERELKRERRKQSNRESARRSRLRKQAETEELAKKVQALTAENLTLKSEIDKLTQSSEQLKLENATMMEKLKSARLGHAADLNLNKFNEIRVQPVSTANLLARVNNSGPTDRSEEEGHGYDNSKNTNSGAKLHQLLDASPRTDAVAAG
ncbi:OLC1v1038446C1 [Oldenlandia corymbosa var. corymbosa]|uniref:OLC1v1038446C1 n=1 Tax=Oldenlandia corymbosa var. corymbosa TaxID=529605 RepID=A0AAV1D2K0_OLDCO|nr:OLC1v1038446C1 [Oldenlandia corymbosa var. corymbosa]